MVLSVGSLVIIRLNHVISFTSGLTAAILIFVGVASNIVKPAKIRKNVRVFLYRSVKTGCKNSYLLQRSRGGGRFDRPHGQRHIQKKLGQRTAG